MVVGSEQDIFVRASDGVQIFEIQGKINGKSEIKLSANSHTFDSNIDGILYLSTGIYKFYKDRKKKKDKSGKWFV